MRDGSRLDLGKISSDQIEAYAEASQDFNPIHLDSEFARSAGLSERIAHGMLSMGLASRALEEWGFDLSKLKHFESKFKDKVFLNERLFADELQSIEGDAQLEVRWKILKEDGTEVLSASAILSS